MLTIDFYSIVYMLKSNVMDTMHHIHTAVGIIRQNFQGSLRKIRFGFRMLKKPTTKYQKTTI